MVIDELVKHPGSWLSRHGGSGIVISSRVRLARNLCGTAFPGWSREPDRVKLCSRLSESLLSLEPLKDAVSIGMDKLADVDKAVLQERQLISGELAGRGAGSALIVDGDERVAIMINEEDHLRLHAIVPGMNLSRVWERIDSMDTLLESCVDYAFSRELGYLTACPSNVGTGLRASVIMHLSGLKLMGELEPVVKGLEKLGLAVRGLLGEGTEAHGDMFQISNQSTLGESEQQIIEGLTGIVNEVSAHERNARARLMQDSRSYVSDYVGRAYGILAYAHVLPSKEAIDLLSALRLGVEMGVVRNLTVGRINEMMLFTQPGHLQKLMSRELPALERDEVRADFVKNQIEDLSLV